MPSRTTLDKLPPHSARHLVLVRHEKICAVVNTRMHSTLCNDRVLVPPIPRVQAPLDAQYVPRMNLANELHILINFFGMP